MAKRFIVLLVALLALPFCGHGPRASAQDGQAPIQVNVVLVQLSVAVTDSKGNYVSGLKPEDFAISEDKIPEKAATFEEGGGPARTVALQPLTDDRPFSGATTGATETTGDTSRLSSANVFVLFDTSNYMYRGFVYAQDAIADFIRSLEDVSKVALYSYSRDLSRVVTLTPDRSQVLHGLRSTVAGDDAALYNSLLLTVKDAAPLTGRKVVVVFSNGPDNASLVPPEDIAELAQSTGTIIYMISTKEAQSEPISTAVFQRMSTATGGKAYFSKDWQDEKKAFESIRDDLGHLYALSYYPASNPNRGWRTITVKLVGKNLQKYHLRTRTGYRLLLTQTSTPLQESKVEAH
ncbi:MAG TPA: VWA domain-containing protein [Acidobacteriaceae bacterium]